MDDAPADRLQGLGMLASAVAGKAVAVAELPPGEPAWTDGQTIHVDGSAGARVRLDAVAAQAALIAAGSLDFDVVRLLVRHRRLTRRYLAIEGHRALVASAGLLPRILVELGDREIARRSDSPQQSLRIAAGRAVIDEPAPAHAVSSLAATSNEDVDDHAAQPADGLRYPEWDATRKRYRRAWCTVREVEPKINGAATQAMPDIEAAIGVRRPLARLGMGLHRRHRQSQGDDIDIDAAVEARVEVLAGAVPAEAVYLDSLRRRRDLSVLLLLDVSGSAAEPGTLGRTVHQQQRAAVANLTVALHDLGDRVALYAYYSNGRSAVSMIPVKRFDDHLDARVMQRLNSLESGAYSRLGAAVRHGAAVLEFRGGTSRRLLVVLSDGLAYDHGYERPYGAADSRRALTEARRRGTGCVCLTIGAGTDVPALRRVFGSTAHATIGRCPCCSIPGRSLGAFR